MTNNLNKYTELVEKISYEKNPIRKIYMMGQVDALLWNDGRNPIFGKKISHFVSQISKKKKSK
jgi:hypothetical protein